jgi:hypothetical protein
MDGICKTEKAAAMEYEPGIEQIRHTIEIQDETANSKDKETAKSEEVSNVTEEGASSIATKEVKPWWQRDAPDAGGLAVEPSTAEGGRPLAVEPKVPWWQRGDASERSDASVFEMMGKSAPEPKSNRFVYENEEKEEIEPVP